MAKAVTKRGRAIRDFILRNVRENPKTIGKLAGELFKLSRQSTSKYLTDLVSDGLLVGKGKTRAREYELAVIEENEFIIDVDESLQEDLVWRQRVRPSIEPFVQPNVLTICAHGLTEMLNNVIDHSGSKKALIGIDRTAVGVLILVKDYGVGIFQKIQQDFGLNDPRHALLELSKGKLTSDRSKHSGEGIFFTSRMFDYFSIRSQRLFFQRRINSDGDWLVEADEDTRFESSGTCVLMEITTESPRTTQQIFDRFASEFANHGFTKTHVPIRLSAYDDDQLVSRSAAKRVLARVTAFKEVLLDFEGVDSIGQAFADEIFRVFPMEHPDVVLWAIHTTPRVRQMIDRAKGAEVPADQMPLV